MYRVILAHLLRKIAAPALSLDNDAIRDMYVNQNMTLKQIADKLGTNPVTISNRLKDVQRRPRGRQLSKKLDSVIHDMYVNENLGGDKIAQQLGISQLKVYDTLKRLGVEVRPAASQKPKLDLDRDLIRDMYVKQRRSTESIAKSLGVSVKAINSRLKEMGVELRKPRPLPVKLVYDMYVNQGMTLRQISKLLGSSEQTVKETLLSIGVKPRSRWERFSGQPSAGDNALIQKMLLEGKPVAEVIQRLDVSQGAVEKVLKELRDRLNQIHLQHEEASPVEEETGPVKDDQRSVVDMHIKGKSVSAISRETGLARRKIEKILLQWARSRKG